MLNETFPTILKHRDGRQLSFYYYAFCTQMAKFQESYLQAKTKKIIILAIIDFRYSKKEEVIHSIIFPKPEPNVGWVGEDISNSRES